MGRIVVTEFVTLDGVIEAPGHEQHRDGKNAWSVQLASDDMQRWGVDQLFAADALLFGRVTYQIWAAFWPTASDQFGFATKINEMPKFVASRTLRGADWTNSTVIGDVPAEVPRLKESFDGDILVYGSADLVNSLLGDGLIDEFRLLVHPVVLGSGRRLFKDPNDTSHLRLVDTRTFTSGVVLLTYRPTDQVAPSPYAEAFTWTEEQMGSLQAAQSADRVLASILFTDIVDSTGRAAALGDVEWRRVLDRHDRAARADVERFRGRFVKTTGDGILATFDTPTRALRCAFELGKALAEQGIGIRAAVHTGEIDIGEEDVAGIGVHIAARALAEAGEGQVIVTRTVKDLATGTDLVFTSLGAVGLRGVPGEWELFVVSSS